MPRTPSNRFDGRRKDAVALGEQLFRESDYIGAAEIFRRLHDADPSDPLALRLLGLCQMRLGSLVEAHGMLERAFELAPDSAVARLHYAMALHAGGQSAKAAEHFERCIEALPDDPAPYVNLCAARLALHQPEQAVLAAREACRRAPDLPQAHYMLGQALLQSGTLAAAEQALLQAVKRMPDFAEAWVALGAVYYRSYNLKLAIAATQRAVPSHVGATANLAVFLRLSGRIEESETLLREGLKREPTADSLRLNLAVGLLLEERGQEALGLLDRPPNPVTPELETHWQLERAAALVLCDKADQAEITLASVHPATDEQRTLLDCRKLMVAQHRGDVSAASAIAERVARDIKGPNTALPESLITTHFELAKFWAHIKRPQEAFDHWTHGHQILGKFQRFSRRAHQRRVDAMIETLDAPRLQSGPQASNRDQTPVFIVGMPRSGTTLTEQILGAHHQVFAAGERTALIRAVREMSKGPPREALSRISATPVAELDAIAQPYLERLKALSPSAARIVDKMPANYMNVGIAKLLFPAAKFIHCTRDPRDVGLSIFSHRFFGEHGYAHDLRDLGWYIAQHDRMMDHWRAVLPSAICTVPLTDWVEDFDATLARVLGFLDLPHDPKCLDFHEQKTPVRTASRQQVREPINAKGIGRWRSFEPQLRPLIEELQRSGIDLAY